MDANDLEVSAWLAVASPARSMCIHSFLLMLEWYAVTSCKSVEDGKKKYEER